MAEEKALLTMGRHDTTNTSMPTDASDTKKSDGRNGNKRAASESLEQNVTKVAKLTPGKDDDIKSETEVKVEPDPKDEEIARLKNIIQKHKAKIVQLEVDLEDVTDELNGESCRRATLEAREKLRMEKETLVETSMTATMTLATRNLRAQLSTDYQRKEKDMRKTCREKADDQIEKNDKKWEKKVQDIVTKAQDKVKELQDKVKKINTDHKQEVKDLKEKHKEEVKSYKPDHSNAVKEKVKQLKAKDKRIADLEKSTEGIDALNAEKENLANELEKARTKIRGLRQANQTIQADKADMEGAYNHKLEHEAARWKIQNDIAEDAKVKLMYQQRSNFALRSEVNVKNNLVQALQQQLQTAQQQGQISTADAAVQGQISTTNASVQTSSNVNEMHTTNNEDGDAKAPELDDPSAST